LFFRLPRVAAAYSVFPTSAPPVPSPLGRSELLFAIPGGDGWCSPFPDNGSPIHLPFGEVGIAFRNSGRGRMVFALPENGSPIHLPSGEVGIAVCSRSPGTGGANSYSKKRTPDYAPCGSAALHWYNSWTGQARRAQ